MASIKAKCARIVHILDVKQARCKGRHVTSEVSKGDRKYVNGERNNFPSPEDTMEKNMNEVYVQDEDFANGFVNEDARDGHCEKIKESWLVEEARNTQFCVKEEGTNEILVAVPEDGVVDVGQDMDGGSLQECGMEADIKVDTSCLAGEDDPVYTVFMGDQAEEEHEYKMRYAGVETSVSGHVETADHVKKQSINLMGFPEKEDVSNGDRGTTLAEWALIMDALEAERLLKETMETSNQAREADKAHIIPEIVAKARNSIWKTVDVALENIRNVQESGNWTSSSSGIGIDIMLEGKDAPLEETVKRAYNICSGWNQRLIRRGTPLMGRMLSSGDVGRASGRWFWTGCLTICGEGVEIEGEWLGSEDGRNTIRPKGLCHWGPGHVVQRKERDVVSTSTWCIISSLIPVKTVHGTSCEETEKATGLLEILQWSFTHHGMEHVVISVEIVICGDKHQRPFRLLGPKIVD